MALAKYLEDLTEDYFDQMSMIGHPLFNIPDTTFDLEEKPAGKVAAWVVSPDGRERPMEDQEVFKTGPEIQVLIKYQSQCASPLVQFGDDSSTLEEIDLSDGRQLTVGLKKTGKHLLRISSGAYVRDYRIEGITPVRLETIPKLRNGFEMLSESIESLDRTFLEKIRDKIGPIENPPEVPHDFCKGVLEYALALMLEQDRNDYYKIRLEASFAYLRKYGAYSSAARFICDYFFYRLNDFDNIQHSSLLSIGNFFRNKKQEEGSGITTDQNCSIPIMISSADRATFDAIDDMRKNNLESANRNIEIASEEYSRLLPDQNASERLAFCKGTLANLNGDTQRSARYFNKLESSMNEYFRTKAAF